VGRAGGSTIRTEGGSTPLRGMVRHIANGSERTTRRTSGSQRCLCQVRQGGVTGRTGVSELDGGSERRMGGSTSNKNTLKGKEPNVLGSCFTPLSLRRVQNITQDITAQNIEGVLLYSTVRHECTGVLYSTPRLLSYIIRQLLCDCFPSRLHEDRRTVSGSTGLFRTGDNCHNCRSSRPTPGSRLR